MAKQNVHRAIIEKILTQQDKQDQDLTKIKLWACRQFGLHQFPRNSEILQAATDDEKQTLRKILRIKPIRSVSGVYIITVMPKPYPCPKDEPCIYCPGGPDTNTPQSYTGCEPAGRRAREHNYDPYEQVKSRINQFNLMGHTVDKVELIIFGGTITAYPQKYLESFVTQCLNAMTGANATTITDAQTAAENAKIKNSDITIETRPDYCKQPHIDLMLNLGTTRVELGVQTIYEDIYKQIRRNHTIDDVVEATRTAKDSGLAVIYHMMPGLPGSTIERDLTAFKTIFSDEQFKPDALKIYPTLVLKNTRLYELWKKREYEPYTFESMCNLIVEIKKIVPRWVRIQRIQRDIPSNLIEAGIKRGDLRLLVQQDLYKNGEHCNCIRCREIGHVQYKSNKDTSPENIQLVIERYPASHGEEILLTFEDTQQNMLIGLLRLRHPSKQTHRPETHNIHSMLVRELHVYGQMVQVGSKPQAAAWQHRGWGEQLMREAERISHEEFDAQKIIVLAGIGTRNYYRRFGYERDGPYMSKILR